MANTEQARADLKALVEGTYALQKLRIQMGNRITTNWKTKMGQAPGQTEDGMDADAKKILLEIRKNYDRITDGLVKLPRPKKFVGNAVISSYTELSLIDQYRSLESAEKSSFGQLKHVLAEFPIWTEFLEDVRGCGPAMAGVIISEIDIHKAQYVTSLWRYAGLDVAEDGRGRSRRAEHLIDVEYVDKEGETKTKKSITFNPFLKTKLTGVLIPSFIKCGDNMFEKVYRDVKHREQNKFDAEERSKGHINNRAIRYAAKIFLSELYNVWRRLEGLEVAPFYEVDKLGREPHSKPSPYEGIGLKQEPLPSLMEMPRYKEFFDNPM